MGLDGPLRYEQDLRHRIRIALLRYKPESDENARSTRFSPSEQRRLFVKSVDVGGGITGGSSHRNTRLLTGHGRVLFPLCGIALAVCGFFAWSAANFASTRDALLYLKGVSLVIEPGEFSLGEGSRGEERTATFQVRNLANEPIQIVGARASCTCLATEGLPLVIPARESRELRPIVHLDGKPLERVEQEITYLTSSRRHPAIRVRLVGRIGR